jgi:hypothetical protein
VPVTADPPGPDRWSRRGGINARQAPAAVPRRGSGTLSRWAKAAANLAEGPSSRACRQAAWWIRLFAEASAGSGGFGDGVPAAGLAWLRCTASTPRGKEASCCFRVAIF